MIVLLKDIFKVSESKSYKKGDKVDFGTDENKRLVKGGVADFVKVTKEKKIKIKKK